MAAELNGEADVVDIITEEAACPSDRLGSKRKANLFPKENAGPLRRERASRSIVSSEHLSTMVAAYHRHFAIYSKDRKEVTQLVPGKVWKAVYLHYKETYPDSQFAEDTLKDRLRDTLKESKTGDSNEPQTDKAVSQREGLVRLRSRNVQVIRNILKKRQSLLDGLPTLGSTTIGSSVGPDTRAAPQSPPAPTEPPEQLVKAQMTKAQMLQLQASSIASLATIFQASCERRDALLQEKCKKVKIANLKSARDLGVITYEELKEKVKAILEL